MDNPSTPAEVMWLRLDDLLRAEAEEQRAERARWARINEAFPPKPTSAPSTSSDEQ